MPGNKEHKTLSLKCKPGHCVPDDKLTEILGQHANTVETAFPEHEYDMVQVGRGRFNFVWLREKNVAA